MKRLLAPSALFLSIVLVGCAPQQRRAAAPDRAPAIAVAGPQVLVDGKATTLFGFRVGSAPLRDDWTDQLIAQLGTWRRHGVNALVLWLQGTSGGFTRVFTADGAISSQPQPILVRAGYGLAEVRAPIGETTGAAVIQRSLRIVDAAAAHGMVVIVGVGYEHAWSPTDTQQIVERAMRASGAAFADRRNVMLDVWNETDIQAPLQRPDQIAAYARALRAVAPGRPICAGSNRAEMNPPLATLPEVDAVCHDAGRSYSAAVEAFEALRSVAKPVLNVESYGGAGGGYVDHLQPTQASRYAVDFSTHARWRRVYGAWEEEDYKDGTGRTLMGRRAYRDLVQYVGRDRSAKHHLFVHVAGWFQGASRVEVPKQIGAPGGWTNVFHPGEGASQGTSDHPGIGWLLREIAQQRPPQHNQVLFDVDLTRGDAGAGKVLGGRWNGGWQVTGDGQRIVWDAGRSVRNGTFEVWFTQAGRPVHPQGLKAQWAGLHGHPSLNLSPQYMQLRVGQEKYGFSKLRVKGGNEVRCETTGGSLADWKDDGTSVQHVKITWRDGVPSFTDPQGRTFACTSYWKATGAIQVDGLRWAFVGSDNSEAGAALNGLRVLRVRLVEHEPAPPASVSSLTRP